MEAEKFEAFEEDFEAKPAMYQVWVLGYDKNEAITDFEVLVNESRDPERMVEYAKTYIDEKRYETLTIPDNVEFIEVLVETVVDVDDCESNEGTLFTEVMKLK
jgi:hypothetical protein